MSPKLPLPKIVPNILEQIEGDIKNSLRELSSQGGPPPEEFLPPHHRIKELGGLTVSAVKNFAELPTQQIDELIVEVKNRLEKIERKANEIKSDYMKRTTELTSEIERLNNACIKSETKLEELHDQLNDLYAPPKKESPSDKQ
jgi:hypothetical protein